MQIHRLQAPGQPLTFLTSGDASFLTAMERRRLFDGRWRDFDPDDDDDDDDDLDDADGFML